MTKFLLDCIQQIEIHMWYTTGLLCFCLVELEARFDVDGLLLLI